MERGWGCNLPLKKKELKAIASEIIHLARKFNQREGVTKKDDKLPRRFSREVLGETRKTIQPKELEYMLKEYYQMRGRLNPATYAFQVPEMPVPSSWRNP